MYLVMYLERNPLVPNKFSVSLSTTVFLRLIIVFVVTEELCQQLFRVSFSRNIYPTCRLLYVKFVSEQNE